jgi:hypothetical protein
MHPSPIEQHWREKACKVRQRVVSKTWLGDRLLVPDRVMLELELRDVAALFHPFEKHAKPADGL